MNISYEIKPPPIHIPIQNIPKQYRGRLLTVPLYHFPCVFITSFSHQKGTKFPIKEISCNYTGWEQQHFQTCWNTINDSSKLSKEHSNVNCLRSSLSLSTHVFKSKGFFFKYNKQANANSKYTLHFIKRNENRMRSGLSRSLAAK